MELRRYFQIIRRYWLLVLVLGLVGLLAAYQYYTSNRPTYQAQAQVRITQIPSANDPYSGIYANQSSEYAADDFTKIIPGNRFMEAVSSQLKEVNTNLTTGALQGMVAVERKHRILTITTSSNNPVEASQVARAIADTLETSAATFVEPRDVKASVVNVPSSANLSGGRTVLLAAVRVIAGLLAGIGLAFLLAYLDNSIKTKAEAEETLGLPTMGLIPAYRSQSGVPQPTMPPTPPDLDQLANARLMSLQAMQNQEPDKDKKPVAKN